MFTVGGTLYASFFAIGTIIPLLDFFAIIFLVSIISVLPVSIGSLGVKEWAIVALFSLIGVSAEIAISAAIVHRLLQMLVSFLGLPTYLYSKT